MLSFNRHWLGEWQTTSTGCFLAALVSVHIDRGKKSVQCVRVQIQLPLLESPLSFKRASLQELRLRYAFY